MTQRERDEERVCEPTRPCQIPSCPNSSKHTLQGVRYCDPHYHEQTVEETCECPPGAWHRRDCTVVYWPESAA